MSGYYNNDTVIDQAVQIEALTRQVAEQKNRTDAWRDIAECLDMERKSQEAIISEQKAEITELYRLMAAPF